MANREVSFADLVAAYQEAFSSPAGQIVLQHMAVKFGFINRSTNVPGDPYGTHINEGHRGVLVYIGRMMAMDPNGVDQQAVKEGNDET